MLVRVGVVIFNNLGGWGLVARESARLAVVPFAVIMHVPSKGCRLFR